MEFRISDTFSDSLARLSGDEQKAVKTTAFDLQMNPSTPGMQFHKLDRAKDPRFWSVRVSRDIRLIVHRSESSLLLCYVGHHDDAYGWAERRKIERHPKTGAAQLVEIRERVQEILVPKYVDAPNPVPAKPRLFTKVSDDELMSYGVPTEWLADVRTATEDSVLELIDHLPREAGEALLDLATGAKPKPPEPVPVGKNEFEHPDARRRFRLMTNVEELERALDYPWEKWSVFLHPAQQDLIERQFNGPARVLGTAGTGKTVVALHRAAFIAKARPSARVLLTTFSETLASSLRSKMRVLLGNEPQAQERVAVHAIDAVGKMLYGKIHGRVQVADAATVRQLLGGASKAVNGHHFSDRLLRGEWDEVVDAWQLTTWEEYRDVSRLGRKTRLGENQRKVLWEIFRRVIDELKQRELLTMPTVFARVTQAICTSADRPFDYVVVDEAQDVSIPQLRFLAAMVSGRENALFFTGDLGQRIFQSPFSWKSLGVDVRGRSVMLRINYRTSHQIRRRADRLLPHAVSDVDGNSDERSRTISVFNGPDPVVTIAANAAAEKAAGVTWLQQRINDGFQPHEIGVFVRSEEQLDRAMAVVSAAALKSQRLDEQVATQPGCVSIGTMHLAKGLEFRAVLIIACDDDVIPLQERIESVADEADLEEVYNTERHLLYVACTRARDHLMLTAVSPGSEFLGDMNVSAR